MWWIHWINIIISEGIYLHFSLQRMRCLWWLAVFVISCDKWKCYDWNENDIFLNYFASEKQTSKFELNVFLFRVHISHVNVEYSICLFKIYCFIFFLHLNILLYKNAHTFDIKYRSVGILGIKKELLYLLILFVKYVDKHSKI